MANNIDLFDTYTMIGMVSEIAPKQTFFKARYFPTGADDIFNSQKVLLEYEGSNQKMAVFVADKAGDIPVARDSYGVLEFMPPKVAPSRLLTLDQLQQRGFGEALFSQSTPAERAQRMHLKDLIDLDARITRREEWMCAQVLITNGVSVAEYVDDKDISVTRALKFYTGETSDHIYTRSAKWNGTGGDFLGDVTAMAQALAARGLPAEDLVLGATAASELLKLEAFQKLLDNRRFEMGGIAPTIAYPGVALLGRINFGGFMLNVWSVYETYEDAAGTSTAYFPLDAALVTAPNCGRLLYGAVTQIEPDDQFHTFAMPRVPKFVADRNDDLRKLRITSRPLPAPRAFLPYVYAADVV